MIAIARARTSDRPQSCDQTSRHVPLDPDMLPGLTDDGSARFGAAASPWRAPLFYLSFVAGACLLAAIAAILLWRILPWRIVRRL